jgi:2-aminoadipate transaminase
VLNRDAAAALNYGPNPGYTPLREWLATRMHEREEVEAGVENILVTTGGLEALHLVSLALLDPGSLVLAAAPTYLVALHVFRAQQARIISVEVDQGGACPDSLQSVLNRLQKEGVRPRFLYLIPSFQNPSGLTLSLERRKRILEICRHSDLPIVEDHAYAELRYQGKSLPALKTLAPEQVVFLHTFSKIFGPGVRLGWICADTELIETAGLCKLGTDQCPNSLTQRLVLECAREGIIEEQVTRSIALYRHKRDLLLGELKETLPDGISWTYPEGGFFTWLKLSQEADSEALLKRALDQEKVAFVAGPPFFADGRGRSFLRLSFSFVAQHQISEGVKRLGRLLRAET